MNVFISSETQPTRITLDRKLGAGGEGTVYSIAGDTTRCVKIYHEKKRTPELEAKLTAMISSPPKDPTLAAGHYSICWPQAIVYEDEACSTFIGFIMPLIDTKVFREYHLLCDKPGATSSVCYRLENFGTGFTYLHMYVVALNLASCVASIHEAGHAIGDLNDKNILVSTKDSKITIVDCDSFEIHGKDNQVFPCSVYMPEYSAPEVIKHENIENRQYSDRFALAVLIFKLLMLNTHPYASRGSSVEHLNTPGEKIADGYYPYEDYDNLEVFPPAYALPYDIIPPNVKELFRRCFKEGQHNPVLRPSVREWFEVIKDMYQQMFELVRNDHVQCTKNPLHMFPLHLTDCPWCAMKDDYFPERFEKFVEKKEYKEFYYIEKMLEQFCNDNHISRFEYEQMYQSASRHGLSANNLNELIREKAKENQNLILGDAPDITPDVIDVGKITNKSARIRKSVKITNSHIFEEISVELISNCPAITINPRRVVILARTHENVQLFYDPKLYVAEESGCFMEKIECKLASKSLDMSLELKVIGEHESPNISEKYEPTLLKEFPFLKKLGCNSENIFIWLIALYFLIMLLIQIFM